MSHKRHVSSASLTSSSSTESIFSNEPILPASRGLRIILPLLIWAISFGAGVRGLNFGWHWDEMAHCQHVAISIDHGLLLPGVYQYPSFLYGLHYAILLPHVPAAWRFAETQIPVLSPETLSDLRERYLNAGFNRITSEEQVQLAKSSHIPGISQYMRNIIFSDIYLFQRRGACLLISSLAIWWIFQAGFYLSGRIGPATVAAAYIAFSWEAAFHSRWIAPDMLLTQFIALFAMLLCMFLRFRKAKWAYWMGAVAGLAMGTKYTAIVLGPVTVWVCLLGEDLRPGFDVARLRRLLWTMMIMGGCFLVTTPGIVLDPIRFIEAYQHLSQTYQLGVYADSIEPGFPHVVSILQYLLLVFPSPFVLLSVLFSLLIVGGIGYAFRQSRYVTALLLFAPVFMVVGVSGTGRFVPRNVLPVTPFLALMLVEGIRLLKWDRQHWMTKLAVAVITLMVLVNAVWIVWAGETIRHREWPRYAQQLANEIEGNRACRVAITPNVQAALTQVGFSLSNRLARSREEVTHVAFLAKEFKKPRDWLAHVPAMRVRWFGPAEVNINDYPTWHGDNRFILVNATQADAIRAWDNLDLSP